MSFPRYVSVIFNGRRSGKTWTIMDEIRDLGVQNRTAEVLVVVPNAQRSDWWIREWRSRFPALTPPRVISIQNTLPVRGYRFERVYVEDIDIAEEGIYEPKLFDIWPCLVEAREPEIVFTCSPSTVAREREEDRQRAAKARQARRRFIGNVILRSNQTRSDRTAPAARSDA